MAGKRRRIKIERRRERIRYGRATLTVECQTSVLLTSVGDALEEWRAGDKTAEQVAWAFVKQQTVKHSPTFKWQGADLAVLLPRVTKAVREPNLKARTPDELMVELERQEQKDQEVLDASSKLTQQWTHTFTSKAMSKLLDQWKDFQPDLSPAFSRITLDLGKRVREQMMGSQSVLFGTAFQAYLNQIIERNDFTNLFSGNVVALQGALATQNWDAMTSLVIDAARDADYPEVVEAVEVTSEETQRTDASVDALLKGLQPMFNNLEKAIKATKDSASRVILLAVAAMVIFTMLQVTLAKFGIHIVPQPPPPAQEAPKPAPKIKAAKPAAKAVKKAPKKKSKK